MRLFKKSLFSNSHSFGISHRLEISFYFRFSIKKASNKFSYFDVRYRGKIQWNSAMNFPPRYSPLRNAECVKYSLAHVTVTIVSHRASEYPSNISMLILTVSTCGARAFRRFLRNFRLCIRFPNVRSTWQCLAAYSTSLLRIYATNFRQRILSELHQSRPALE